MVGLLHGNTSTHIFVNIYSTVLTLHHVDPLFQFDFGMLTNSRIGLGLLGVILVALSVVAAIGLLSYLRIKATLIIIEVVPFLVLAVGTDNLFILTHAFEVGYVQIRMF